jgi:hypothetical protein
MKTKFNTTNTTSAYRGYLVRQNLIGGEFHVSKDGYHITTQTTIDAAKTAIDSILD